MAIDRLSVFPGKRQFGQHLFISCQDPREIHHFRQVADLIHLKELINFINSQASPGRFKRGGRNAGRGAKGELKRDFFPIFDHKPNPVHAQHIGYFVRIGYCCDGSMDYR